MSGSNITAKLTSSEKAAIQKQAKKAKMTMTDYIIQCALGKENCPGGRVRRDSFGA
ncbi:plasmid mobilization protein [Acutalibacter intestini]|uniref:plasmid mobilization protein n=1 Tax=Acutalibacter intestini TaxID=3093659 RepID=UPI003F58F2C4